MKADELFNKVLPKKFIVFVIATVGMFMKLITGEQWMIVASIYLGVNVMRAVVSMFQKKDG